MSNENISYEMGVMFFNVVNHTETGSYDLAGNFNGFLVSITDTIVKEKFDEGFIAESENHGISKDKCLELLEENYPLINKIADTI